jgi:hypothetical protein
MKRTKDLVNEMSEFESFILSEIKQAVQESKRKYYTEKDIKFAYEQGARLALISQSPMVLHKGEFPTPDEWFEQFKNK